jgi:hypothetical protein
MLNKLIHGPVGFHNAVRISAGFIGGLLIIGNLLMKTRLPTKKKPGNILGDLREFLKDPPFVFMALG